MINTTTFGDELKRMGFDFYSGVPCSFLKALINYAINECDYVMAANEGDAVAIASGAKLGGKKSVVLMQNSGLGTSLNALASLSLMYGFPTLLVVTWRGHEGKDAPEHILTGAITPCLLDLLGIPYRVLSADTAPADIAWAAQEMDTRMQPVALIVPPKVVQTGAVHGRREGSRCEAPRESTASRSASSKSTESSGGRANTSGASVFTACAGPSNTRSKPHTRRPRNAAT